MIIAGILYPFPIVLLRNKQMLLFILVILINLKVYNLPITKKPKLNFYNL